ncbi:MAG: hypothetical protein Q8M76_17225 [Spirochaetaceae bacterium]|nr:hypothetical protein [Spirochaetaceae bacterium]
MQKGVGKALLVLAGSESALELGRAIETLGISAEIELDVKDASKRSENHRRIGSVLMDQERAVGLLAAKSL